MEFRQLRYFVCIARLQSMTRAAEVLFIAQPALSMQMRNLEEELGVQLLSRNSRGVQLTEAGRRFLEKAIRITREVEAARNLAAPDTTPDVVPLRLGINPSLDGDLIASILNAARDELRATKVTILEGASDQLAEWLLDDTLDMALIYFVPDGTIGIACERLFRDRVVLLTDCRQPARPGIRFEQLAEAPIMLQPRPHKLRSMIDEAAAAIGCTMRVPLEIRSVHMTIDLVERGLAPSMLPERATKQAVLERRINISPVIEPSFGLDLCLAYLESKRAAPSEVALRQLIRDIATA